MKPIYFIKSTLIFLTKLLFFIAIFFSSEKVLATPGSDLDCTAAIGSFSSDDVDLSQWVIPLCYEDSYTISPNGDYTPPPDYEDYPVGPFYDPGILWLIYSCPPSVSVVPDANTTINDDPCMEGFIASEYIYDINDGLSIINSFPPGTFPNNIVYLAPITMYSNVELIYSYSSNMPCYEMGDYYAIQYLPDITYNAQEDCSNGTVSVTTQGGSPAVNGTNFTGTNLSPPSLSFTTGTAGNGGTIVVGGLVDGDNYSFDIVDEFGCTVTVTSTFEGGVPADFTYQDNSYCLDGTNPIPTVTGNPNGSFSSTPSGLSLNSNTGEITLSNSTPGNYTITYTTTGVCPQTVEFQMEILDAPSFTVSSTSPSCGMTDGTITFSGLNPNSSYTISYSIDGNAENPSSYTTNGSGEITINNLSGGVYNNFSVTSDSGCNGTISTSVTLDSAIEPVVSAPNDFEICIGEQVTLTATNNDGSIITWDNGVTDGVPFTPSSVGQTTYTVSATIDGCTSTDEVTITVNDVPTYTVSSTSPSCGLSDGTITISGLNPNTSFSVGYSLNGSAVTPSTMSSNSSGEIIINNLSGGTYNNFTVTTNEGCVGSLSTTINLNPATAPVVTAPNDIEICVGEEITLTASNPDNASISWNNGVTDGTPFTPTTIGATTYTVSATIDACTTTDDVIVTVHDTPVISLSANDICEGGSVTITASGASTYTWNNGSTGASNTITPQSSTVVNVVGISAHGCEGSADISITVYSVPTFGVSSTDPSCGIDDGVITFSGLNSNTSYSIEYSSNGSQVGSNTMTSNGVGEIALNNLSGGTYTNFTVTSNDGCTGTVSTVINLVPAAAPIVTAPNDIEICIGEEVTLTAISNDGASISWNNGVNDGVPFSPTTLGATTYTVSATIDDCVSTDDVVITVHDNPVITLSGDNICEGESVTITASGANTYAWDNGSTGASNTITPENSITVEVIGVDANGCVGSSDIFIVVNPLPEPSFIGDILMGCKPHTVNFTNTTQGGVNCEWNLGDGNITNGCGTISHTYIQSNTYNVSLTVTNQYGCTESVTYNNYIEVNPSPIASFSTDSDIVNILEPEVNFNNNSEFADFYIWDFGDESPISNEVNPTHSYADMPEGEYIVTLIASNGNDDCNDTIRSIISVEENLIFYVPNTFTPDDNHFNDEFKPVFTSGFDLYSYTLEIYNRWGELLFVSHDLNFGWEGSYGVQREGIVPEGTYIWKIKFKEGTKDKWHEHLGYITLIR